ncbi:excinuclease ABC subunit UvrA, partial [Candidatus Falkowbacteria bacterium]|nr:excinuclease ABC subunit UvrA [Candidatus Falkowbacteria bacterium]
DVDSIDGLGPAISIDQRSVSHNPRSTVGTITEIYDYLRLLFARVGIVHCPKCGDEVSKQTIDQIVERVFGLAPSTSSHSGLRASGPRTAGSPFDATQGLRPLRSDKSNPVKIMLLAPVIRDKKGEHKNTLEEIQKAGYVRVRIDNNFYPIEEAVDLDIDKKKKHSVDVVVDRLEVKSNPSKLDRSRLSESLEATLDLGDGLVVVYSVDENRDILFSQHFACPKCDINLPELEPRSFSFNSPYGACPECTGLGVKLEVDPELIIPNKNLTVEQGAIRPWSSTAANQGWYFRILKAVSKAHKFSLDKPIKNYTREQLDIILQGTGNERYTIDYASDKFEGEADMKYEGVIPNLERRYRETQSDYIRSEIEKYMRIKICPKCGGKRLKPEVLAVTVGGKSIAEVTGKTVGEGKAFFEKDLELSARGLKIANQILKEIVNRLSFLENVGLDYITLNRAANTLSGGEAQRIRLATQIGSALTGVIYILDEPTIGLHQRDNERLIETLKHLRDVGNTVIVVEHDEGTIRAADHIIDVGPGAGEHGGRIVAEGNLAQILKNKDSLTGKYMSGKMEVKSRDKIRKGNGKFLEVLGAEAFNLKKIDVRIPLGKFVCITGVSGSGKSTLMIEILAKALAHKFYGAKDLPGKHKEIKGLENVDKVINIDQSPIGRTPRSNPATYTGVFTYIRDLFTQVPEAKIRGYKAGRFSFNVRGGRCEACQGDGLVKIEMNFLPDVYVECEVCKGKRYNKESLEIHYKGKNISDILEMTVEEAMKFFSNIPIIYQKLKTLNEVGLGYLHLGQSATTLSGGEAQRVKLSTELSRRATGKTLYILDEPTTGLHFADVDRLLKVLHQLVDKGNTILVIEHNMDVIKNSDFVVDLGPEGGGRGGYLVASGTPDEVMKVKSSYTGQWLRKSV